PEVDLTLVSRRHDAGRWEGLAGPPAAGTVLAAAPGPRPLRLAWEQLALPRLLTRSGVAVHHGPHYTMPERATVPVVVTVHDCTFFDHPEWHERSKVRLFRRAITVAARRAAVIVCVSATTAERLEEVCPVPTGRRWPPSVSTRTGPWWCSSAPWSPARTCRPWSGPSTRWPMRIPRRCWSWQANEGGAATRWSGPRWRPNGTETASSGPGTSPTTPCRPCCGRRPWWLTRRWPRVTASRRWRPWRVGPRW